MERVVQDKLDEERLEHLAPIGVDEVSWPRRHRDLTCVADHRSGDIVSAEGRKHASWRAFLE
jgi:hypothetical protein